MPVIISAEVLSICNLVMFWRVSRIITTSERSVEITVNATQGFQHGI